MRLLLAGLNPANQDYYMRYKHCKLPYLDGGNHLLEDKFSVLIRSHLPFLDRKLAMESDRYATCIRASFPYFDNFKLISTSNILSSLQVASAVSTNEEKEWMATRLTETCRKFSPNFFVTYPSESSKTFQEDITCA